MRYRKTQFRADHYYHLYNRGNNRQPIFFCSENLFCAKNWFCNQISVVSRSESSAIDPG